MSDNLNIYTNELYNVIIDGVPYRIRHLLTDKILTSLIEKKGYTSIFKNPHEIIITFLKNNQSLMELNKNIFDLTYNKNPNVLDIIFNSDIKLNYYYIKYLCSRNNDKFINFITNNLEYMTESSWINLCCNPNNKAFELLNKHNKLNINNNVYFMYLCMNSNDKALDIVFNNLDKFKEYPYKDYLYYLCLNTNDKIIQILELYKDKLDINCWLNLLKNPNIKILNYTLDNMYISHTSFLSLKELCKNTNDKALDIVMKYSNLLDENMKLELLYNNNPKAIQILLEIDPNLQIIKHDISNNILSNPNIFTYDYNKMKQIKSKLHNELNYVFMK